MPEQFNIILRIYKFVIQNLSTVTEVRWVVKLYTVRTSRHLLHTRLLFILCFKVHYLIHYRCYLTNICLLTVTVKAVWRSSIVIACFLLLNFFRWSLLIKFLLGTVKQFVSTCIFKISKNVNVDHFNRFATTNLTFKTYRGFVVLFPFAWTRIETNK